MHTRNHDPRTSTTALETLAVEGRCHIGQLDAETVIVEGHTDSIGPVDVNLKLSEERAVAVADYISALGSGYPLEHVGHGDTVPIAANGTAEGRATNRRVDLVVSVKK